MYDHIGYTKKWLINLSKKNKKKVYQCWDITGVALLYNFMYGFDSTCNHPPPPPAIPGTSPALWAGGWGIVLSHLVPGVPG